MRSLFATLLSLVLPSGAISGARLVLDGVNGRIEAFDAFNDRVIIIDPFQIRAQVSDTAGFVALDPATPGIVLNDAQATFDASIRATTAGGVHRLRIRAPGDVLVDLAQIDLRDDDTIGLQCQRLALDEATQAATGPVGAIVGKVEVTDDAGVTIGFLPVYDTIV